MIVGLYYFDLGLLESEESKEEKIRKKRLSNAKHRWKYKFKY